MSEASIEGNEDRRAGDGIDAQLTLVSSLATENEVLVERLREVQIPQHVGMAAGGRALAADLPRALLAQVQNELSSGALGQRWEAALKRHASTDGGQAPEALLAAVATLLVDQAQRAGRYLAARAEEWASDAYRLEGQASALESQAQRLQRAHEGIARSRTEGEASALRQEERRRERESGTGPGHAGGDDGHHA